MELNLKHVSKVKQQLIHEALRVWTKHWHKADRTPFITEMKQLGWSDYMTHGHGSFKTVVWKGSIVAKFIYADGRPEADAEIEREWEQFRTAPKKLKRHLPKSYCFKNGLLIQDRVLLKCADVVGCNNVNIGMDLGLQDYGHNHGHSKAGTVKYFDWVWRRMNPWLNNLNTPLKGENE